MVIVTVMATLCSGHCIGGCCCCFALSCWSIINTAKVKTEPEEQSTVFWLLMLLLLSSSSSSLSSSLLLSLLSLSSSSLCLLFKECPLFVVVVAFVVVWL